MATKVCPPANCQNLTSRQRSVISATDFNVKNGDMKFDPYSALHARSRGQVRSNKETDQLRPEGGDGGGSYDRLRLDCAASLQLEVSFWTC